MFMTYRALSQTTWILKQEPRLKVVYHPIPLPYFTIEKLKFRLLLFDFVLEINSMTFG